MNLRYRHTVLQRKELRGFFLVKQKGLCKAAMILRCRHMVQLEERLRGFSGLSGKEEMVHQKGFLGTIFWYSRKD
jgi:hypothetical protein